MNRRLGRHIPEGQTTVIAVHLVAGDLSLQDAPKNRVTRHGENLLEAVIETVIETGRASDECTT
jgi:CO dehydrogenase/acetyl-CoA synthase delta subunit